MIAAMAQRVVQSLRDSPIVFPNHPGQKRGGRAVAVFVAGVRAQWPMRFLGLVLPVTDVVGDAFHQPTWIARRVVLHDMRQLVNHHAEVVGVFLHVRNADIDHAIGGGRRGAEILFEDQANRRRGRPIVRRQKTSHDRQPVLAEELGAFRPFLYRLIVGRFAGIHLERSRACRGGRRVRQRINESPEVFLRPGAAAKAERHEPGHDSHKPQSLDHEPSAMARGASTR